LKLYIKKKLSRHGASYHSHSLCPFLFILFLFPCLFKIYLLFVTSKWKSIIQGNGSVRWGTGYSCGEMGLSGMKFSSLKYTMLLMLYRKVESIGATVHEVGMEISQKQKNRPGGKHLNRTAGVSGWNPLDSLLRSANHARAPEQRLG
jgi:hypothetical protein